MYEESLWWEWLFVADDSVSADIKLETETEDGGVGEDIPPSLPANMYHPRRALRNALTAWLPEFRWLIATLLYTWVDNRNATYFCYIYYFVQYVSFVF